MNPSDPIEVPPELDNVPEPDRTLVAVFAKHIKSGGITKLPQLAHIPEKHRAFAFAFYSVREHHPKQKAKWHDELPSAVFVAVLFVTTMASGFVGFSMDGQRGGVIGFALNMVVVLTVGAVLLHRHWQKHMRDFFQSEECRSFIAKLK